MKKPSVGIVYRYCRCEAPDPNWIKWLNHEPHILELVKRVASGCLALDIRTIKDDRNTDFVLIRGSRQLTTLRVAPQTNFDSEAGRFTKLRSIQHCHRSSRFSVDAHRYSAVGSCTEEDELRSVPASIHNLGKQHRKRRRLARIRYGESRQQKAVTLIHQRPQRESRE